MTRVLRFGMGLFGLIPFVFENVGAQSATTVSVEAGAMNIQQRRASSASGVFALADAVLATRLTALSGSLLFVQVSNSSATQGQLGGEFALPLNPSFRVELSGTATRFDALASRSGASRAGFVRPQFAREHFGVFGTFGAGVTSHDNERFHALAGDVGIWAKRHRIAGSMTVRQSYANDYDLVEASGIILSRDARYYSIRDFVGVLSLALPKTDLQLSGALRNGYAETKGSSKVLSASATIHLTSRLDVSLNAGELLADLMTGVPQSSIVGASLRLNVFGRNPRASSLRTASIDSTSGARNTSPFATQIRRHATGGATVVVRVDAPTDAHVEISGTFNNWTPATVVRGANGFEHMLELPSGTHRISVRVNGREWKAPVGLARIVDDLGGEAGLIVIP